MDENELRGYQRAMAGLLTASVIGNAVLGARLHGSEAAHSADTDLLREELRLAERSRDSALERYSGLVLELQRHSREQETRCVQEPESAYAYIGECTITYYCCEQYEHICGGGLTATGIPAGPGIVAVDPEVIPLGSTVLIDGQEYLAADTGGAVRGLHVDICTDTHAHALALGTHTADVWIVNV